MAFATADEVKTRLKNMSGDLIGAVSQFPEKWSDLIDQMVTKAKNDIRGILRKRAYTIAQIATWNDDLSKSLDLTCFYVLEDVYRFSTEFDMDRLAGLDIREAIASTGYIPLDSDGDPIDEQTYDDIHAPEATFDVGSDPVEHGRIFNRKGSIVFDGYEGGATDGNIDILGDC